MNEAPAAWQLELEARAINATDSEPAQFDGRPRFRPRCRAVPEPVTSVLLSGQ